MKSKKTATTEANDTAEPTVNGSAAKNTSGKKTTAPKKTSEKAASATSVVKAKKKLPVVVQLKGRIEEGVKTTSVRKLLTTVIDLGMAELMRHRGAENDSAYATTAVLLDKVSLGSVSVEFVTKEDKNGPAASAVKTAEAAQA